MSLTISNNSINLVKNSRKNEKNINFSHQINKTQDQTSCLEKKIVSADLCRAYLSIKSHKHPQSVSFGHKLKYIDIKKFKKEYFGEVKNIGKKEIEKLKSLIESEDIFKNFIAVGVINKIGSKKDLALLNHTKFNNILNKTHLNEDEKKVKNVLLDIYMKHGGKEHYPIIKKHYLNIYTNSNPTYLPSFFNDLTVHCKNRELVKEFLFDSELMEHRAINDPYGHRPSIQDQLLSKVHALFTPKEAVEILENVIHKNESIKDINSRQYKMTLSKIKSALENNSSEDSSRLLNKYFKPPEIEKSSVFKTLDENNYYDTIFRYDNIEYFCKDIGMYGGIGHFNRLKDAMNSYKAKSKFPKTEEKLLEIISNVAYGREDKIESLQTSKILNNPNIKALIIEENEKLIEIFDEVQKGTKLKEYDPSSPFLCTYDDYIEYLQDQINKLS